ncbi:hypothetical protein CVT26_013420 [Gymnopilus dilepis]|uniref:Uncharacterized protein n=1 Tax=Gymnopilus dilepis TaxID=231916 RepID=A0A409VUZ5_9AGAR|nr:hypothetical protein CVT26_013420 [Gymnopilus dilepis]
MPAISPIALAIQHFIQEITDIPVDHPIDHVLEDALVVEHEIRSLLACDPQNVQLQDKFLGLFDVFSIAPAARRHRAREIDPGTTDLHKHYVFPLPQNKRKTTLTPSAVPNIEAFKRNWEIFTHRALFKMSTKDWQNVLAAGGSVLACIKRPNSNTSAQRLNEYYQSSVYESSDIDLFLWGLTPEQAEVKMKDIYRAVCEATAWKVTCVRKANTVSLHTKFPYRPIQIVLRLYQSPAEILAGFDIDAACCAYDGHRVWANPRFLTALVRQSNTIDLTRRSPSYEMRLVKYARRGFEIFLPTLRRDYIKQSTMSKLYSRDLSTFPNGLARLLVLEVAYFRPNFYRQLRFPFARRSLKKPVSNNNSRSGEDMVPSNDYDGNLWWAQIPYGPSWDADKIEALIAKKDAYLNSPYNPYNEDSENGSRHRHVFFAGTMAQCLGAFCNQCDNLVDDDGLMALEPRIYIRGPIKYVIAHRKVDETADKNRFITVNPGRQLATGSFQPVDEGEWTLEAYESLDGSANDGEDLEQREGYIDGLDE